MSQPHRVVVFCPNPYSLYTSTVTELLLRQNVEVLAIVVKKFSLARFRQEFARDGKRLYGLGQKTTTRWGWLMGF